MTQEFPRSRMRVERVAVAAIISALLLSGVLLVAFDQEWAKPVGSAVVAVILGVLVVMEVRRKRAARPSS